ncbi:penicillin-binding protein 1C [Pseudolabrys sp.]|uniref:penicillin-binding protein 1C n=1 Tax=Pseudolabrys sp. TaxID=1960880 RepID=UPI003D0EEE28
MRLKIILAGFASLAVTTLLVAAWWVISLGPVPLGKDIDYSRVVLDRNGQILRAYTAGDGRWRLPATVEQVDPQFLKILFAYEDHRFEDHIGVDPFAMARAAWQFAKSGHIVSGGSTLTMQVARLLEPRRERSLYAKLKQAVRALELEYVLSKDDILALYLSLAPYGGNIEGIRAASWSYFGKEPRRLTLGEAALLVALPQSPETRRPDRHHDNALAARNRVLERVARAGAVPYADLAAAKAEPVPHARRPMPILAPHAADEIIALDADIRVHRLTIESRLQHDLEQLAQTRALALGPHISAAIVAVDNETGDVLARVGSAGYFAGERAGQVDMTQALRSPGSTLKPFIYGLAFEDGFLHPETLIDDAPVRYGSYAPENFDQSFQGTVTVRRALQLSLNVPAIAVLDRLGTSRLAARLQQAGASLVLPKGEAPGLAMGLGGVGVTLSDLTMLYTGLARGGVARPLIERAGGSSPDRRLLDPVAAWYIGNVLLGAPPPDNAPRGQIAFKTGTSYGFRDAWAVGFDGRTTIGVWVGRPDGAPVPGLIGRAAAAPILFDAFARLGRSPAALETPPGGVMRVSNSRLPPTLRHYHPGQIAGTDGRAPRIMFPPDGATLDLPDLRRPDPVAVKISGGEGRLSVLVNGVPLPEGDGRRTVFFTPDGGGFVRLTVMDGRGATDSVVVRLQ